jgi:hypothetical protein
MASSSCDFRSPNLRFRPERRDGNFRIRNFKKTPSPSKNFTASCLTTSANHDHRNVAGSWNCLAVCRSTIRGTKMSPLKRLGIIGVPCNWHVQGKTRPLSLVLSLRLSFFLGSLGLKFPEAIRIRCPPVQTLTLWHATQCRSMSLHDFTMEN